MGWLGALIASSIGGVLLNIAGSLIGRVLTALGVGVVSYVGVDLTLTYFKNSAVSAFTALPSSIVGLLSLMQVGSCVSMVFSAMLMRLTLQGLTSGSIKSWVKK